MIDSDLRAEMAATADALAEIEMRYPRQAPPGSDHRRLLQALQQQPVCPALRAGGHRIWRPGRASDQAHEGMAQEDRAVPSLARGAPGRHLRLQIGGEEASLGPDAND